MNVPDVILLICLIFIYLLHFSISLSFYPSAKPNQLNYPVMNLLNAEKNQNIILPVSPLSLRLSIQLSIYLSIHISIIGSVTYPYDPRCPSVVRLLYSYDFSIYSIICNINQMLLIYNIKYYYVLLIICLISAQISMIFLSIQLNVKIYYPSIHPSMNPHTYHFTLIL